MNSPPRAPFAAVVLAGGRSRRMGRDKASLTLPDGRTLLDRQLALLDALGPTELFVSARSGQTLPRPGSAAQRVNDDGAAGPLGGIVATLRVTTAPRLLVVAVDLPLLTRDVLERLLSQPGGVVPRVDGQVQPLAAVYPRSVRPRAEAALQAGRLRLTEWVQELFQQGEVAPLPFEIPGPFTNWNEPNDLPNGSLAMGPDWEKPSQDYLSPCSKGTSTHQGKPSS